MAQLLTARASVIADRMVEILEGLVGDEAFFEKPLLGVSYGDQEKIPDVPWVCVEPVVKDREEPTPGNMTEIWIEVQLLVYYMGNDEEGVQDVRRTTDRLAETLEEHFNINYLHMPNAAGDDLVIYGYCRRIESGYTRRGALYRSCRITWRGRSKLRLNQAQ